LDGESPDKKGFKTLSHKDVNTQFEPFAAKMRSAGIAELAIDNFQHAYMQLAAGATGLIPGMQALPVESVPSYDSIDEHCAALGRAALDRVVVLKLNGGLGTSMGLDGPKSLLPVKNGLNFLDITVRQVMVLRRSTQARLPLLLMNSFSTQLATLEELQTYSDFHQDIPLDFVQNMVPKICKETLSPADWPADPEKEWCPPGHGDIYPALVTTGLLERMLEAGYEYLFVSNSDNLGAVLDQRILGYFAESGAPFLMEVAQRTAADSKGGHLAQRPDGQLILRESAQCPEDEVADFQDIVRYRFFNTNNLWIHLPALQDLLSTTHGVLDLPLIRNEKPIDATKPDSPRVYQLETAMGSAIAVFPAAQALCVPRSRFAPVKKNSDLLALWSDAYEMTADYRLVLRAERNGVPPVVTLDDRYYGLIDDLRLRFAHGAPSLLHCTSFSVEGDVRFDAEVRIEGKVEVKNSGPRQLLIARRSILRG
jgi:UTP--glucose-1-phosphate uridylyltransferase